MTGRARRQQRKRARALDLRIAIAHAKYLSELSSRMLRELDRATARVTAIKQRKLDARKEPRA